VRVLVTGATGFVGTHLCSALRDRRLGVLSLGTDPGSDYQVDVRDAQAVMAAMRDAKPTGVFHLAALAFVPSADSDPALADAVNRGGTCNVLDAAAVVGARTLVVSSGAVYGRVPEEALPVSESWPLAPVGAYAKSKAAAEEACIGRAAVQSIVRVRPFNQAGPGQSPLYVCSDFANQIARCELNESEECVLAVGDLSAERDFVDVRDAVEAYIVAWERGAAGEVYNVCSGVPVAIGTILDLLLAMSPAKPTIRPRSERMRPSEVKRYYGTSERLHAKTGWSPTSPLVRTLGDLLSDWRARVRADGMRSSTCTTAR
jgi:GDP-4-dehydro-6-deoxy-D-mannose reductase